MATMYVTDYKKSNFKILVDYTAGNGSITINNIAGARTDRNTTYDISASNRVNITIGTSLASVKPSGNKISFYGNNDYRNMDVSHSASGFNGNVGITVTFTCPNNANIRGLQFNFTIDAGYSVTTPSVSGVSITNITETSMSYNWYVVNDGNAGITEYVTQLAVDDFNNVIDTKYNTSDTFTGLEPNKTYYIRAYANNGHFIGYSAVSSGITYMYPYANSMPNFTIGDQLTLGIYNPLNRKIAIYLYTNGVKLGGDEISSSTISGYNSQSWIKSLYETITSGSSANYNVEVVYDGHVETRSGGTYSISPIDFSVNKNDLAYDTENQVTINDKLSIIFTNNKSNAKYKIYMDMGDERIYTQDDTNISAEQIESAITNYLGESNTSKLLRIGVITQNYNNENVIYKFIEGTIGVTQENSSPTFTNFSYDDATGLAIAGELIESKSIPRIKVSTDQLPIARYGAKMKYYKVNIGNNSSMINYSSEGTEQTVSPVSKFYGDSMVSLIAYDTRGFFTIVSKLVYIVPYEIMIDSSKASRKNNYEDETTLSISGKYSTAVNKDGVTINNDITSIRYRYKAYKDEEYGNYIDVEFTTTPGTNVTKPSTGSYRASPIYLSLDKSKSFNIQIEITDRLGTVLLVELPTLDKGIAIMYINTDKNNVGIGCRNESGKEYTLDVLNDIYISGKSVKDAMITDFDKIYPVGSIYMSINETNPADLFGGTWESIEGRFLIGVGSNTDDNGETWDFVSGQAHGEYNHTLVDSEIPNYTGFFPAVVPGGHANYCKGIFEASSTTDSGQTLSNDGIQQGGSHMWGYSVDIGGNGAHNNMPPYLAVYMWKRIS